MGQQDQQRPGQNGTSIQSGQGQPEKLARGIVARGHSIDVPDLTKRAIVSHSPEGKPIYRAPSTHFLPGQEVELPASEIAHLRERGFIVDPNLAAIPPAEGSRVIETGSHLTVA